MCRHCVTPQGDIKFGLNPINQCLTCLKEYHSYKHSHLPIRQAATFICLAVLEVGDFTHYLKKVKLFLKKAYLIL